MWVHLWFPRFSAGRKCCCCWHCLDSALLLQRWLTVRTEKSSFIYFLKEWTGSPPDRDSKVDCRNLSRLPTCSTDSMLKNNFLIFIARKWLGNGRLCYSPLFDFVIAIVLVFGHRWAVLFQLRGVCLCANRPFFSATSTHRDHGQYFSALTSRILTLTRNVSHPTKA